MQVNARQRPQGERGVAMVLFAIMAVAMIGILALAIDLGMLFGQRRFDQNGADAAALAAGRLLANSVALRNASGDVYFNAPDEFLYQQVRQYAGLDPNNFASSVPTGWNQNPGLLGRNALKVTLEYSADGGATWCYSRSETDAPPRIPAVPPCPILLDATGKQLPPYPVANKTFKVRVTVSSTTDAFIAQVIGGNSVLPAPPSSDAVAACLQADPTGNTTCAQAVVRVGGAADNTWLGANLPVTMGDCHVGQNSLGTLYMLWGPNPPGCEDYENMQDWKNVLDFTSENKWCDNTTGGNPSNPDYKYYHLLPISTTIPAARLECARETPDTWNRSGFVPDTTSWTETSQTGQRGPDVSAWIAKGFGGQIVPGNKLPTYGSSKPTQGGNIGQNIADGFYCGPSGVSADGCDTSINPAGTYFFRKSELKSPCPDQYGSSYNVGCRDATIPTWSNPEWADGLGSGGTGWNPNGSGGPDRIRVVQWLPVRIYCELDNKGFCTRPPGSIPSVGSYANSQVWGQVVSPFLERCPEGETCGTPTIYGNVAVLER